MIGPSVSSMCLYKLFTMKKYDCCSWTFSSIWLYQIICLTNSLMPFPIAGQSTIRIRACLAFFCSIHSYGVLNCSHLNSITVFVESPPYDVYSYHRRHGLLFTTGATSCNACRYRSEKRTQSTYLI